MVRRYKFILLLSLILIVLVALNGVSATDTNLTTSNTISLSTNTININDVGNNVTSLNKLAQSDNSSDYPETTGLADTKTVCNGNAQLKSINMNSTNQISVSNSDILYISPDGTGSGISSEDTTNWADAYNYINDGGTIYFTGGNYTSIYNQEISKNLTLSSYNNANVFIDASNKGYIFYIPSSDTSLTLNGLTLINGIGYLNGGSTSGGAINTMGNLTLINSSFINNIVTSKGGAIYTSGNCTIINSFFINNSADSSGAIAVEGENCNISGSTFINNTCVKDGGAISFLNAIVTNSSFINNSANNFGGAIV